MKYKELTSFVIFFFLIILFFSGCTEKNNDLSNADKENTEEKIEEEYPDELKISGFSFADDTQDIAWDGEYFWVVNEGSVSPYDAYIFKINPKTGEIVGVWNASVNNECGAEFDGKYLWTTGTYNPNGIQPPWEDPQRYDVIHKYSIENDDLVLLERYGAPDEHYPIANALSIDREGNIWVFEASNAREMARIELLTGVESDYHPGLENVWKFRVVENRTIIPENWNIKGAEFVTFKNGKDMLVVGGYFVSEPYNFIAIYDPDRDYEMVSNYSWPPQDPPYIGTFGVTWDVENEILWTIAALDIRQETNESHNPIFDELFK